MQDEDSGILPFPKPINRCRPSIPARSANDCHMVSLLARFPFVPPRQEVFKQIPQSDIYECQSWPVEELKEMQILLFAQGNERRNFRYAERRVTPIDQRPEIRGWDFGR